MNAREQILATIRAGLRGAPAALPPPLSGAGVPPGERVERFTAMLTKVGGRVDCVADLAAAGRRVRELLAAAAVQRLLASDAPELRAIVQALPAAVRVLPVDAAREESLAADAGITCAQWGIAETGTLVLASAAERNRLASLLPALHVVVLPAARLLGSLGEAFARLRAPDGAPSARTITFVTGPSRTADIELTLVVGVHGPKDLHVIVVTEA